MLDTVHPHFSAKPWPDASGAAPWAAHWHPQRASQCSTQVHTKAVWSNFCLIKKAAANKNYLLIVTQNPIIINLHGVSTEEYLKPLKIVFSPEMLFMTCHKLSVFRKLFLSPSTSLLSGLFELYSPYRKGCLQLCYCSVASKT